MIYKILEIREDADFGCEERSEDMPLLSEAVLTPYKGKQDSVELNSTVYELSVA